MSERFTTAFEVVRDGLVEDEEEQQRQYLNAPERLREAEEVEPCVERFVDLEFDPPEGKGAGRGKMRWPMAEPLAKSLSKQLEAMDEADREWMRDTVTVSIAFGYVLFCVGQSFHEDIPAPTLGGDPQQLWERWMLQLPTDVLKKGLNEKAVKHALEVAHFENAMKKHDYYSLKTAGAIKLLSGTYGRAGLTLRLLQCTTESDVEPHKKTVQELPNWPFDPSKAPAG
jgi:hypothetical protein